MRRLAVKTRRIVCSLAVSVPAMLAIAACGSAAGSSGSAAACLQNMLDTAAATPTCQHSRTLNVSATGQNWAKATSVAGHVTCIRKTGNEYFCQDGPGNQYAVVYDGTHLAYQPSP